MPRLQYCATTRPRRSFYMPPRLCGCHLAFTASHTPHRAPLVEQLLDMANAPSIAAVDGCLQQLLTRATQHVAAGTAPPREVRTRLCLSRQQTYNQRTDGAVWVESGGCGGCARMGTRHCRQSGTPGRRHAHGTICRACQIRVVDMECVCIVCT